MGRGRIIAVSSVDVSLASDGRISTFGDRAGSLPKGGGARKRPTGKPPGRHLSFGYGSHGCDPCLRGGLVETTRLGVERGPFVGLLRLADCEALAQEGLFEQWNRPVEFSCGPI